MEDDFPADKRQEYHSRIQRALESTFQLAGYRVFDVKMQEKPQVITPEMAQFWGGYRVEFKIIETAKYQQFADDLVQLRQNALRLGDSTKFLIDISRFEFTEGKERRELNGHDIFVYTPPMIVCEKLRAICQQMREYDPVVKRTRNDGGRARARDFLDIHTLITKCGVELTSENNLSLLRNVFEAKRVPLGLLEKLEEYREIHRLDFPDVVSTLKVGVKVETFDFYFDFVQSEVRKILERLQEHREQEHRRDEAEGDGS